jgi:hypothetical protein
MTLWSQDRAQALAEKGRQEAKTKVHSDRWKGEVSSPSKDDLSLIANMGGDSGDEFQIIHRLLVKNFEIYISRMEAKSHKALAPRYCKRQLNE